MNIINAWVGYVTRTLEQIKASLIASMPINIPEITDTSDNNPLVKIFNVWAWITEHINYYIDSTARETFLIVARLYQSAFKRAVEFDYRVKGAGAPSAPGLFVLPNPAGSTFTIPKGTEIRDTQNNRYFTVENITFLIATTSVTGDVEQAIPYTGQALGTSTGQPNQKIQLNNQGYQVVEGSVGLIVNGVQWTAVDTFAFSDSNDQVFVAGLNINREMEVRFGDGITGAIPTGAIVAAYKVTSGVSLNNIQIGAITSIQGLITVPGGQTLSFSNTGITSGGYDREALADLQTNIPIFVRTLNRAVTPEDYAAIALLYPGVQASGLVYNCGKFVAIYIAPAGGGAPSGTLLNNVAAWMDDKKMLTTNVTILGAGIVALQIEADVTVLDGYPQAPTKTAVMNNLLGLLSPPIQTVGGGEALGDVYKYIETTPGVKVSQINTMRIVPYAMPLNSGSPALTWTRAIQDASNATKQWTLVFTDATHFQLLMDSTYIGTYTVGSLVAQAAVQFTITGTYTAGNQYTFWTYKSFGSVNLAEPSYIFSQESDIMLNMIGGV